VDAAGRNLTYDEAIHQCDNIKTKAQREKKTLDHEVRLIRDSIDRDSMRERIKELEDRLNLSENSFKIKHEHHLLFDESKNNKKTKSRHKGKNILSSNDKYLETLDKTHDDIESVLMGTLSVINETQDMGDSTLHQLEIQNEQIDHIHNKVKSVDNQLSRSNKLIRKFKQKAFGIKSWFMK